jgi:23S rRNA (adenine2030-N6)-methyltransferase
MYLLLILYRRHERQMPQLRWRAGAPSDTLQKTVNYRHAYHAGNFADVVKHLALVSIVVHLKKKEKGFVVIDTHAGRGLYDLQGDEATKTAEAESGIGRLTAINADVSPLLNEYLSYARAFGDARYPGSPLFAAQMLRPQDRLVAIEKHPGEMPPLSRALAPYPRARAVEADGYERLIALLPPAERRGLVLIDPPYEAPDEFARAAEAVHHALRRFATGVYMVWFPIKSKPAADGFCAEVVTGTAAKALRIDIDVGANTEGRLHAAGLLIINPPYGFDEEMRSALAAIANLLGTQTRFDLDWLLND